MAFIPALNCVKVAMKFTWGGQTVINTFFVERAAPFTEAQRTTTIGTFKTWWTTHLKVWFSPDIALIEISATNQDSANAPGTTIIYTPEPGTATGSSVPLNVSLVTTHRTPFRGRNYRGRAYWGGLRIGDMTDRGTFGLSVSSGLAASVAQLIALLATNTDVWTIVSRFLNKVARGTAISTGVSAVSADQFADSQRRRLIGRGI